MIKAEDVKVRRVLIVDDHEVVRRGIAHGLRNSQLEVIGEASSCA